MTYIWFAPKNNELFRSHIKPLKKNSNEAHWIYFNARKISWIGPVFYVGVL